MPVKINGASSGSVTLAAPASGSDVTVALPAAAGTLLNTPGAWTAFTPSMVSITLGNGTLAAAYCRIGRVIHFRIRLTFGSGTSISGTPAFALPVSGVTDGYSGVTATLVDAGTTYPTMAAAYLDGSHATVRVINTAGTYINVVDMSATVPWTWATGDIIDIAGTFEATA